MVAQIASGAPTLKETAESLSHASGQVATASHYQADSTSSMAAAIEQMAVSINHNLDSARETEEDSSSAATLAQIGGEQKMDPATK